MDRTRELLFGAYCLRSGLIEPNQFAETCSFVLDGQDTTFSQALIARGWISPADATVIDHRLAGPAGEETAPFSGAEVSPAGEPTEDWQPDTVPDPALARATIARLSDPPKPRERYRLTKLHAIGGIGEVWLARDGHLGREVALKKLRRERLTSEMMLARFLEEARITGQLEHPSIVPVYELAEPAEGRLPFYAMRFVRGRTVHQAARDYHRARGKGEESSLDLLKLLNAFVAVCNAVAYAHSRGVIHRDLKPQNVLLGDFGEVILLDWGLAKVLGQSAKESGFEPVHLDPSLDRGKTLAGRALGTPAYMAPEQAQGLGDRIDERTDVYGLGAMLYEILTGRPPFHGDDTRELLRLVCEQEPDRPRTVNPTAPPALEAVCRMAMAKDRSVRYPSAADLARDVQRWLADEPVAAYPDPWTTRASRWARRHKPIVAGAAALLITALVALGVSNVLIGQARADAVLAGKISEANFKVARMTVDSMLTKVADERLATVPQAVEVRKQLADEAVANYGNFLQYSPNDPALRLEASQVFRKAANNDRLTNRSSVAAQRYKDALALLEKLVNKNSGARSLRADLVDTANDAAEFYRMIGRFHDAVAHFLKAQTSVAELRAADPTNLEYQRAEVRVLIDMSHLRFAAGQYAEAIELGEKAIALLQQDKTALPPMRRGPTARQYYEISAPTLLGASLWKNGRPQDSGKVFVQAIERARDLRKHYPDDNNVQFLLAWPLTERGCLTVSDPTLQKAAESDLVEAVDLWSELVKDFAGVPGYRRSFAVALRGRAAAKLADKRTAEAQADLNKARGLLEALVKEFPHIPEYPGHLGRTLGDLAHIAGAQGRDDDARTLQKEAVRFLTQAKNANPDCAMDRDSLKSLVGAE